MKGRRVGRDQKSVGKSDRIEKGQNDQITHRIQPKGSEDKRRDRSKDRKGQNDRREKLNRKGIRRREKGEKESKRR